MMSGPLRILLLEDSPADAELSERELRKAGIAFTSLRVETRVAFVAALDTFRPDLILADYSLPEFDGLQALAIVRERSPDLPYIFVTGAMGEEQAVESIKQGATDYLLKDRLTRLSAAVQQALERSKARQQQSESEEKFRKITESAQDAIIMMGADQRISFWNAAAEQIFGYTAVEAIGQDLHALVAPPAARAAFKKGLQHYFESGEGPVIDKVTEVTALRKGGEEFPAEAAISSVHFNGQWHAIGIVRDITERKQAEKSAQAAAQYARSLIEASLDPLVTISAEGKITDVNTATEQVTGVPRDKLTGSDFADYFTAPEKAREGYQQAFTQGFVTDYPLTIRHVSGKTTDVLYNASVYRDGSGHALGVFAAARDITERKRGELALRERMKELTCLYAVSRDLQEGLPIDELCRRYVKYLVPAMQFPEITVPVIEVNGERYT